MEEKTKKEIEDMLTDSVSQLINKLTDAALEAGEITPERAELRREKTKIQFEIRKAEAKLSEVTKNTYIEIGKFMNEYYRQDCEALKALYEKCKKWLDDNNLPYEEKIDEEE